MAIPRKASFDLGWRLAFHGPGLSRITSLLFSFRIRRQLKGEFPAVIIATGFSRVGRTVTRQLLRRRVCIAFGRQGSFYFASTEWKKTTTKKLYVRQQVQGIVMVTSSTLSEQDGDLRLQVSRRGHSPTVFRTNVLRRIRRQENGHGKIADWKRKRVVGRKFATPTNANIPGLCNVYETASAFSLQPCPLPTVHCALCPPALDRRQRPGCCRVSAPAAARRISHAAGSDLVWGTLTPSFLNPKLCADNIHS